ncbi:MAG: GNAT family N-acetyltransferase [Solirubrobacteraceae bacterium]
MSYHVEPFTAGHDLDEFDCGHDALNSWLRHHAERAAGQGTRTYLLVEDATGDVVGYFSLVPHLLEREDAPPGIRRGAPQRIPAILLAKLALDKGLHGQGLGAELLIHALTTIVAAARAAGGRLVVVDAVDESASDFYRAHDFKTSSTDPLRLIMKLSTAARALGLVWP